MQTIKAVWLFDETTASAHPGKTDAAFVRVGCQTLASVRRGQIEHSKTVLNFQRWLQPTPPADSNSNHFASHPCSP